MYRGLSNPQHTQILSFNVEGLKAKLDDQNVLRYDIILLTETWKVGTSKLNIEGFWDYSQVRPQHKNSVRHSEGTTVLEKDLVSK